MQNGLLTNNLIVANKLAAISNQTRNPRSCFTIVGCGYCRTIAILVGSITTPQAVMTCPRYSRGFGADRHLLHLRYNLFCPNNWNMVVSGVHLIDHIKINRSNIRWWRDRVRWS